MDMLGVNGSGDDYLKEAMSVVATYKEDIEFTHQLLDIPEMADGSKKFTVVANKSKVTDEEIRVAERQLEILREKGMVIGELTLTEDADAPAYSFTCVTMDGGKTTSNIDLGNQEASVDRTVVIMDLGLAAASVPEGIKDRKPYEAVINYINKLYASLGLEAGELIASNLDASEIVDILHNNPIIIILPPVERENIEKQMEFELQLQLLEQFA